MQKRPFIIIFHELVIKLYFLNTFAHHKCWTWFGHVLDTFERVRPVGHVWTCPEKNGHIQNMSKKSSHNTGHVSGHVSGHVQRVHTEIERGMDTFKRVLETGHIPGHVAGDWTCFGHVHSDTFNVSENVSDSLVGNCTAIFFKYSLNFNFALVNRI